MRTEPAIAFDFGLRRIGVATTSGGVITPREYLKARAGTPEWAALDRLVREYGPQVLVLGRPSRPNAEMDRALGRFHGQLRERYALRVETVDEDFTSSEAHARLKDFRSSGHLGRRVRKGEADSLAACLIARDWQETAI